MHSLRVISYSERLKDGHDVSKCVSEIYVNLKELPTQREVVGPRFKKRRKPSEIIPEFRALFPSR